MHLRHLGAEVGDGVEELLEVIEQSRAQNTDVAADQVRDLFGIEVGQVGGISRPHAVAAHQFEVAAGGSGDVAETVGDRPAGRGGKPCLRVDDSGDERDELRARGTGCVDVIEPRVHLRHRVVPHMGDENTPVGDRWRDHDPGCGGFSAEPLSGHYDHLVSSVLGGYDGRFHLVVALRAIG